MVKVVFATALAVCAAEESLPQYFRKGFVRMPRLEAVEVTEITDEMRAAAPASLDWTTKGATTPVKNQGNCGSCWAYSATEGIESGLFMSGGPLEELSEQEIISCDSTDAGCNGGDLPTAFAFVKSNGGVDSETNYKDSSARSGKAGKCNSQKEKKKVAKLLSSAYAIPPCDSGSCKNQKESDLMAALNTHGPLSVCVNAENWSSDYSEGVYSEKCSGSADTLDHCVQLVGYDNSGSNPYWKVRNSWGASWGESGYIRLAMGKNQCGIADEVMYVKAQAESVDIAV